MFQLHRFPKDKALRDQWLAAINIPNWEPRSNSKLCSRHFNKTYIDRNEFTQHVYLRRAAVPTIFEGHPNIQQTSIISTITNPKQSENLETETTVKKIKFDNKGNRKPTIGWRTRIADTMANPKTSVSLEAETEATKLTLDNGNGNGNHPNSKWPSIPEPVTVVNPKANISIYLKLNTETETTPNTLDYSNGGHNQITKQIRKIVKLQVETRDVIAWVVERLCILVLKLFCISETRSITNRSRLP